MNECIVGTRRLALRLWRSGELDALLDLCRSSGFDDFSTGRFKNLDPEKANEFICAEATSFTNCGLGRFGVFLTSSNTPAGICGLYQLSQPQFPGEIGIMYRLPKMYWGMGIAPEAARAVLDYGFQKLNLKSVSAIIDARNVRSCRVAEKIGMQLADHVIYRNQPRQLWRAWNNS